MTEKEETVTLELPLKAVINLVESPVPFNRDMVADMVSDAYKKTLPTPIEACLEDLLGIMPNMPTVFIESILTKHFGGDNEPR